MVFFVILTLKRSEGEGSYQRRDSSPFAAVGGTPPFDGGGLRMT